jgi:hypothetical protein
MQQTLRLGIPMRALLVIASGLVMLPRSAKADYFLQNIINYGDVNFNQELAINNAGVIAGYFGDGTVVPNNGYTVVSPFAQANFTAENFPSGIEVQTQVTGINNLGNTVGFWADSTGINHGFTDFNGVFTSVDDPASTANPMFTQFLGVNDGGMVAGFYQDATGASHAFTWEAGAFFPILPANSTSATATDVNNSGTTSGFLTSSNGNIYGFLDNGVITTYLYPGSTFTQFLGVNNEGLVVGDYMDAAGNTHGLVFNSVTSTWQTVDDPLAVPGAGNGTTINGLNDEGQIVGFYVNTNGQTIGVLGAAVPEPSSPTCSLLAPSSSPLDTKKAGPGRVRWSGNSILQFAQTGFSNTADAQINQCICGSLAR